MVRVGVTGSGATKGIPLLIVARQRGSNSGLEFTQDLNRQRKTVGSNAVHAICTAASVTGRLLPARQDARCVKVAFAPLAVNALLCSLLLLAHTGGSQQRSRQAVQHHGIRQAVRRAHAWAAVQDSDSLSCHAALSVWCGGAELSWNISGGFDSFDFQWCGSLNHRVRRAKCKTRCAAGRHQSRRRHVSATLSVRAWAGWAPPSRRREAGLWRSVCFCPDGARNRPLSSLHSRRSPVARDARFARVTATRYPKQHVMTCTSALSRPPSTIGASGVTHSRVRAAATFALCKRW
eukprot:364109-Chlamydomonas_euryale.AAC.1